MTSKKNSPPRLGQWLLKNALPDYVSKVGTGDYEEIYKRIVELEGRSKARRWYWSQVIKALPLFLWDYLYWSMEMFKNYLKIAFRNLKRQKGFSLINISGLAIGMACCLLILLYVSDELSFDRFHKNGDRIYRILSYSTIGGTTRNFAISPSALAPAAAESIPEIELYCRLYEFGNMRLQHGENIHEFPTWHSADEDFFSIFSHDFIEGNPDTALRQPYSLVLPKSTAIRIFGRTDVLGETLHTPNENPLEVKITGVIEDIPKNSHYHFDMLLSTLTFRARQNEQQQDRQRRQSFLDEPYYFQAYSYLFLQENADPEDVQAKIMAVVEARWGDLLRQRGVTREYPLQTLKDIHLRSNYEAELGHPGNINYVYLFSAVALLVLIIACFNFINLSTAKSAKRAKEVGLRKVFGAYKKQLIKQFMGESILLSMFGLVLGLILVLLALPIFNNLTNKQFNTYQLLSLTVILGLFTIIMVTGFIAGSFPAFVLSSFHPVETVQGKFASGKKSSLLRRFLVVIQFAISIFMIIGILVILKQLDFMKNKDFGFNKNHMVVIINRGRVTDAFKNQLLQNPEVVSVSFSHSVPGQYLGDDTFLPEGRSSEETVRASAFFIGYDFIETYEMEIVWGRDFSKKFPSDTREGIIINQKMAADIGWGESDIGKELVNVSSNNARKKVIGIVKNFHHKSLKMEINPTVLNLIPQGGRYTTVRIKPEDVASTLGFLEGLYQKTFPGQEFEYYFIDDDFRSKYPEEEKVQKIYFYFGFLAIFVAFLGLYALASYTIEQKTKEVGIRKVLGAKTQGLVFSLSKEFLKWVLLANILAWPTAFIIMNNWLKNFAYRIDIAWWMFIASGILTMTIAVMTISYQAFKSAISDPVEALRYE
ncbi:MAG: ABC transporter permease [Candidatus Aminicenantes bacterium]|nr:ABC transporter permease [Candidatus Aminicenantes bacterium]